MCKGSITCYLLLYKITLLHEYTHVIYFTGCAYKKGKSLHCLFYMLFYKNGKTIPKIVLSSVM